MPLPSTYAMVVHGDGNQMPVGEKGELIVKGPQVMKGIGEEKKLPKKL